VRAPALGVRAHVREEDDSKGISEEYQKRDSSAINSVVVSESQAQQRRQRLV
jgi:hypothetical protein